MQEGAEKTVKLIIDNNLFMQQWLTFKWHLPAGWSVSRVPWLAPAWSNITATWVAPS